MVTTLLELVGISLIVAAAAVAFGPAAGMFVAGCGCLLVSWALDRGGKAKS